MNDSTYHLCQLGLDAAKILGATLAFLIALVQYKKAQQWKRREYISAQMEKFMADRDVLLSMQMLDWIERDLTLKSGKPFKLTQHSLHRILASESVSNTITFTPEEAELRDSFSRFLDWLQQFENDIASKLVSQGELGIYLQYWLEKMLKVSDRHNEQTTKVISHFIRNYGYDGILSLSNRYLQDKQLECKWGSQATLLVANTDHSK
jgi:hypothetical protein